MNHEDLRGRRLPRVRDSYQQIKLRLREAGRLVDAGDVAGADTIIRSLVGVTPNDVSNVLTSAQLATLRKHARKAATR